MTKERYESISLHDLREIAKNRGMRRISTLKKADLIDAMLKKDEEEAIILRKEKMQSRQEAAAEQESRTDSDRQERQDTNTPAAETGQTRQAETGQTRQRSQGQQRGRQSAGSYGQGNTAGRRQNGRARRDERTNGQNNRQAQDRTRPASSQFQERSTREQHQERGTREYQERSAREQHQQRRENQPELSKEFGISENTYKETAVEKPAAMVREQEGDYQNMQVFRDGEQPGQGIPTAAQPDVQEGQQETAGTRLSRFYQPGRPDTPILRKDELNAELDSGQMANGILEVMQDGFGFIRCANYMPGENDIYVAPSQIRRFGLKTGDIIVGNIRVRTQGEKFSALLYVKSVNGFSPEEATRRYNFEDMTPVFPDERIRLERSGGSVSMRIMDLMSPVGKGQRGMIVSPPKAGKTTLIKEVARSVKYNNPEIHLIVLLIDERPEEVTDIREAIEGPNAEVIYSTFDELPEHHKRVSEMAIERARRLVEHKKDVMILLDSITRLTRAYNITEPSSGRTLSGGLDPAALHMPKRFFGAARNMREGGSLTILATALIETGSKMDDIVFEEFKGTGNMELVLDRRLSERRIFPAIDIVRSGTRRDDLLLTPDEQSAMAIVRRAFNGLSAEQAVTQALDLFSRTRTNGEFVNMVRKIQWGSAPERQQ